MSASRSASLPAASRSSSTTKELLRYAPGSGPVGAALGAPGDLPRRTEVREHLGLACGRHRIVGREAARDQHALEQVVELRQRLARRVLDERPENLPLRLPLVQVEAWLDHGPCMAGPVPFNPRESPEAPTRLAR
jgi:hypothetical protein